MFGALGWVELIAFGPYCLGLAFIVGAGGIVWAILRNKNKPPTTADTPDKSE